jgi:DNA-directed RNA polymerase subunit omega
MSNNKGIIDPPIDELLTKVDSKYGLVIFASKRARQINDYYADLHEGSLFDNVGPLVESSIDDKPLSVALREINEDKLSIKAEDKLPVAEEAGADSDADLDAAAAE